jgi:PAS domain S-box-containing protein
MNVFELILSGLIVISLLQGVHVLRLDVKGRVNRIHAALCLANAVWALGALVITMLDARSESALIWNWYRFGALGWCLIPALFFHFCVELAGLGRLRLLLPPYLIGFAFFLINALHPFFVSEFRTGQWGTVHLHTTRILPAMLFYLYSLVSILLAAWLLLRWGKTGREKKQAHIIAWSALATLCTIYLVNTYLPEIAPSLPSMGSVVTLVTLFGIWYAVRIHRLLSIDPGIAASEIMMRMMDMLLILNQEGRIMDANPQVVQNLGYRISDIKNTPILDHLVERDVWLDKMAIVHTCPNQCVRFSAHLLAASGSQVPVILFMSQVSDSYGGIAGSVVVAHDMRGTLQLENEITERTKAESSLKTLMRELETERNLLRRRNAIMEQELDLARRIQSQLVPRSSPGPELAFAYLPMSKVGGDFFDFVQTGQKNELGIFISDVSGHGVPAALITGMVKAFLLKAGGLAGDPAALMDALNTALDGQTGGNFITAWYGVFDFKSGMISFTNAGHGDPYLVAAGKVERLTAQWHNLPLAVMDAQRLETMGRSYGMTRMQISGASRVFLCTDGLLESAPHEDPEDFFGGTLLERSLLATTDLKPAACVDAVLARLAEHRGGMDFEDDICVVCIDLHPHGENQPRDR